MGLEEMVDQFSVHGRSRCTTKKASMDSVDEQDDETDAWPPATRKWTEDDAAADAATLALRIATLELRLALQRMETLLREQRFWDLCSRQHEEELADLRPHSKPTNGWAKSIREAYCGERYECERLVADCLARPQARPHPPEEVQSRRQPPSGDFPSVSPL